MSLIKCSECQKEISDKATSCPNCGSPTGNIAETLVQINTAPEKRRKYRKRYLIFAPMFIIGSILFLISSFFGNAGVIVFWFIVGLIGFIGMIASSIGAWLNAP